MDTTTISSLLLQDTEIAINKVRCFLRSIDLTALDDKKRAIYDITKITTAIKQCQELSSSLVGYRQKVEKELTEENYKTLKDFIFNIPENITRYEINGY